MRMLLLALAVTLALPTWIMAAPKPVKRAQAAAQELNHKLRVKQAAKASIPPRKSARKK